jgi:hypothetical protein
MKSLWWLVCLGLGLVASTVHAQSVSEASKPFRKANAVLLYTSVPADSVLHILALNLRQRGFEVANLNTSVGYLQTAPGIATGDRGWPLIIQVDRIPGGVVLTGKYRMEELPGRPLFPAEFLGFEWSPAKSSFIQVKKTARLFGQGTIKFARR